MTRAELSINSEVGFVVAPGWTHYEIFPKYGHKPFDAPIPMLFLPVHRPNLGVI
jgi:hypothetical protein